MLRAYTSENPCSVSLYEFGITLTVLSIRMEVEDSELYVKAIRFVGSV